MKLQSKNYYVNNLYRNTDTRRNLICDHSYNMTKNVKTLSIEPFDKKIHFSFNQTFDLNMNL